MKAISSLTEITACFVRPLDDLAADSTEQTPYILDPHFPRKVKQNVLPIEITSSDYLNEEHCGGPENLMLRQSENCNLWTGSTYYAWVIIDLLGVPIPVSGI